MTTSARTADATIRNKQTAFNTGVAPSRIRPYIITVSGESVPTSIKVVLKSAKDIRNEMAAEPSNAGGKHGRTVGRKTGALVAPRIKGVSPRSRWNLRQRTPPGTVARAASCEKVPHTT